MSRYSLAIKKILMLALFFVGKKGYCQDSLSTLKVTLDTSFNWNASMAPFSLSFDYLYHYTDKTSQQLYKKHKYLIEQQPTFKNHDLYYRLACSLWDLNKTREAEKMFLSIFYSRAKYYTSNYYHSSDITGDKTTNVYGYGSFTSNYKNYAAIYLTKIYLEQKKFDKALQFLEDAVHKYKVTYSCGTGFHRQQDEYEFLYASCYAGLKRHKDVIDKLLPACLERGDTLIIAAIRNTYSATEIQDCLNKAEKSITCTLDSFPSYAYQTRFGEKGKEHTDTLTYYSGSATMNLFGKTIAMPVPWLENGQHLTKEMFVLLFKESDFYNRLTIQAE